MAAVPVTPPPPQQAQHQQPLIVYAVAQPGHRYIPHMIVAGAVCCLCFPCCVFGLVAFGLALMAFFKVDYSPQLARQLGIASIILSVIAVVLTILVLLIYFLVPHNFVKYTWHAHHD